MKHKYLLLLILLMFSANTFGQYFKNINMKDGLSNPSVLSIYQDLLGRMWFGTNEGVNIYDGRKMEVHKSYLSEEDGEVKLINGSIMQISGSDNGDIFFLNNSTLVSYDIQRERFKEIYPSNVGSLAIIDNKLTFSVGDSLFNYDTATRQVKHFVTLDVPHIWCMQQDSDKIWLGTRKGLYVYANNRVTCVLPEHEIYRLFLSSRNELWVASRMNGLYKIDRDGALTKETHSADRVVSQQIRDLVEDDQNNIWFGTFDGLQIYNPFNDIYKVYRTDKQPGSLEHQSVFSVYKDRQGTIWVGSYYGGVNYFNQSKDIFDYYLYASNNSDYLSCPIVGEIVGDRDHDVWICTDGGGVNLLNRKTGKFSYITAQENNSILHNNIKSIAYDPKHNYIYIGTYTGGLSRCDKESGSVYNYLPDFNRTGHGPNNIIYQCYFHKNYLYVSAPNGLWRLNSETNQFELINNTHIFLTFTIDNQDNIWFASNNVLSRINLKDWTKVEHIDNEVINGNEAKITKIIQVKDGTIYVSTLGCGLYAYNYGKNYWTNYTSDKDGLLNDFCYNVIETALNNVLVTCDKGFSIYSPFSHNMFSIELGLKGGISAITEGCGAWLAQDDKIYLGGVDGMISFDERELYKEHSNAAKLYFSELFINNNRITPNDSHKILTKTLAFSDIVKLSHKQNNLLITFANSNYVEHEKNIRYQYMLQGFDSDWIYANQMLINYTNLEPGNYVLKVREIAGNDTEKQMREILLNITIDRPWYITLWAYLLYLILFLIVLYIVWYIKKSRTELAQSLLDEKNEKERIEELNKMKLRFFTNISHEFRTPLTLIIGQIEMLLQSDKLSPSINKSMQNVYRNAMNMRTLITELLDFRKQEQGFVKLKPQNVNLVAYMKEAYQSFADYARRRSINYIFESGEEYIDVWVDTTQFQKAIYNLLSNAFKYTPEGNEIKISIRLLQRSIEIRFYDTGCGITSKELTKIFERYYQVDEKMQQGVLGTGIGLSLTKSIIEAHKGEIKIESTPNHGSCFIVQLPLGNNHFSHEELENAKKIATPISWDIEATSIALNCEVESTEDATFEEINALLPSVLLVEDDEDILQLLVDIFSPSYIVHTATNGQLGFDMTLQLQPDLVVSDVMMPIMTGKEMCYKIKNCLEVSYIPVVLLTAQASDAHTLEGYMCGADDYMTKPFNVKLLLARCGNLLKNKQRLMKRTNRGEKVEQKDIATLSAIDQKLFDSATLIIRNNFDNTDFDVNMLANGLNMGRSKMFSRLKEISGMTPNELILKLKLEEAVRLLEEETQYNISEISYQLGFASPRYFSRCFKAFYNVSPQNYRKVNTLSQ